MASSVSEATDKSEVRTNLSINIAPNGSCTTQEGSKTREHADIFAAREDHIVPWGSAYKSTALLNPKDPKRNRFVLGASGHIAGVINPPAKRKRSYWTNEALVSDAEAWRAAATEQPGSWWPEWSTFLAGHAGEQIPAPRKFGNAAYKPIEPAPGRYVKVKAE